MSEPQTPPEKPKCKYCEKPFSKRTFWQVFCKPHCRDAYHNLRKALAPLKSPKPEHASSVEISAPGKEETK